MMMQTPLDDLKAKKRQAEEEIANILNKLADETGAKVDIDRIYMYMSDISGGHRFAVKLELTY